jgi:hypothetical protein
MRPRFKQNLRSEMDWGTEGLTTTVMLASEAQPPFPTLIKGTDEPGR